MGSLINYSFYNNKTMSCKLIIAITLITFSAFSAKGNSDYKPGMIITHTNDTLFGLIQDRGNPKNLKVCFYKKDRESKREKFLPQDIKAYRFINGNYYQSTEVFVKDDFRYIFLEVLLKGNISLYYNQNDAVLSYYIQKEDNDLIVLSNPVYEFSNATRDGRSVYSKTYELKTKLYKIILFDFFDDSTDTQYKLIDLEYEINPLVNIIKEYLSETCETDCISYTKVSYK